MSPKKLIEVAIPLNAINKASAREKSIRQGHPSTLHLWWARRPLATARAMIFAQMVDDPSDLIDEFPTIESQDKERQRLFKIIEEIVQWENINNEDLLDKARKEILRSWRREHPERSENAGAAGRTSEGDPPALHDPFAGGGTIPLEAQRLGIDSFASDLNPVSVLINKATIEIPKIFSGLTPVNPDASAEVELLERSYVGGQGLAEDIRYYGRCVFDEAKRRLSTLYPRVVISQEFAKGRAELAHYIGEELTVVAWIWARTAKSPNPAFADVEVPLASSFMLSYKKGNEAYIEPVVDGQEYSFAVKSGLPRDIERTKRGTKSGGSGSEFLCLLSGTPMTFEYLREEGKAGRLGYRLMAIVAEGNRERVYLPPTDEVEAIAKNARPSDPPETTLPEKALGFRVQQYGMTKWRDIFTDRQLVALETFCDVVADIRERVVEDFEAKFPSADARPLHEGGAGANAYADAIATYLSFAIDKGANYWSSLCVWHQKRYGIVSTFGRQTLPMVWDFAEANPIGGSSGNYQQGVEQAAKVVATLGLGASGIAFQADAATQDISSGKVISTDPPYYDNIGYADLSDFFYVWLRRSLRKVYPDLFATVAVPKAEELVASPFRQGDRSSAERFFLDGMTMAMSRLRELAHSEYPISLYYAFKQSETRAGAGTASTGWETFLDAVLRAGFQITGTWPVRTEYTGNLKKNVSALASSIVLVCRRRSAEAPTTTRREFVAMLKKTLPEALSYLQRVYIAPVDLAQAAIGPGMAVFSSYLKVLDAEGESLSVRSALTLINEVLDEALAEQEGDFDADTRWALTWFEEKGFSEGEYGLAEQLSKAKVTSVSGLVDAGIVRSVAGKVRLLRPEELEEDWDPRSDSRLTVWEMVHHLLRAHLSGGEAEAASVLDNLGSHGATARELCYRLYTVCERKKRLKEATLYNGLVQSWPELQRLARQLDRPSGPEQGELI